MNMMTYNAQHCHVMHEYITYLIPPFTTGNMSRSCVMTRLEGELIKKSLTSALVTVSEAHGTQCAQW